MRARHLDALDIDAIGHQTHALADLVDASLADLAVPTCGDWTMADLAYHLFEVQAFWRSTIAARPAGPEAYEPPRRPDDLGEALRSVSDDLMALLHAADPAEEAWSWADDHTVGFTIRRQIHESLVHYIDGVLATGGSVPAVAPKLAADGIDEMIDIMLTGIPGWATFVPSIEIVRLATTDTDDAWTLSLGAVSGTSTETGVTYDGLRAATRVGDDVACDLSITGTSIDVLLWLWGRVAPDVLTLSGDGAIAETLRSTVVGVTQ